jgi:hypothetical protein
LNPCHAHNFNLFAKTNKYKTLSGECYSPLCSRRWFGWFSPRQPIAMSKSKQPGLIPSNSTGLESISTETMSKPKKSVIEVQGTTITIIAQEHGDYISLTDMVRNSRAVEHSSNNG